MDIYEKPAVLEMSNFEDGDKSHDEEKGEDDDNEEEEEDGGDKEEQEQGYDSQTEAYERYVGKREEHVRLKVKK